MIDTKKLAEGITQSEITCLNTCGYKWFLQYNLGLRRKGSFSWALVFGDAFHRSIESMYLNQGKSYTVVDFRFDEDVILSAKDQEEKDYYEQLLHVMVDAYWSHYKNDFKVFRFADDGIEKEADVTIDYRGFPIRLRGKIDLYGMFGGTSRKMVLDHKTCSRLDMVNVLGWDFRFQFMFYVWLCQKIYGECGGFVVNAVKKTALRQKQDESLAMFMKRVASDMKNRPEEYFYRNTMPLTKDAMTNFEENVLKPKFEKIVMLQNPDVPAEFKAAIALDRNTDACFQYNSTCTFLPICQHGLDLERSNYEVRKQKHNELSE